MNVLDAIRQFGDAEEQVPKAGPVVEGFAISCSMRSASSAQFAASHLTRYRMTRFERFSTLDDARKAPRTPSPGGSSP